MSHSNTDREILSLILEKEALFSKEANELARSLCTADLSDYLNGLADLKSDFLSPLENSLSDNEKAEQSAFANRYWYFERT